MGAPKVSFRVDFEIDLLGRKREMYMIVDATSRGMARKLAQQAVPYDIEIHSINPLS